MEVASKERIKVELGRPYRHKVLKNMGFKSKGIMSLSKHPRFSDTKINAHRYDRGNEEILLAVSDPAGLLRPILYHNFATSESRLFVGDL